MLLQYLQDIIKTYHIWLDYCTSIEPFPNKDLSESNGCIGTRHTVKRTHITVTFRSDIRQTGSLQYAKRTCHSQGMTCTRTRQHGARSPVNTNTDVTRDAQTLHFLKRLHS